MWIRSACSIERGRTPKGRCIFFFRAEGGIRDLVRARGLGDVYKRQTYYRDPKITRKERDEQEADIRDKVEQIRVEFPRTGYRMLLGHLRRNGVKIGETKLRRILAKFELQFRHKARFVATTDSNHSHEIHPNLIEELTINGINQVWTADITYIRINTGFVYLLSLIHISEPTRPY